MKHPRFKSLGDGYPSHLEQRYERILIKIEQLWDRAELHDYFSDLLIDKRGGRQGFPKEILNEIIVLREFHELETFRDAERSESAIRELERRGINLKKENFFAALNAGSPELIDLFVRSNFNINVTDENGNQALMLALKMGYTVVARILLVAGADFSARDKLGLTPLLVACGKTTQGYKAIAEMLIVKGAFINIRDSLGFTPLLLSLSGGSMEIARLLIERGADVLVSTRKGETALSLAKKCKDPEAAAIVELLISKGATQ
jgi:ankyrin repeat protein